MVDITKLKKINFFGENYKIKFVDKIPATEEEGFIYGQHNSAKRLITVATLNPEGKPFSKDVLQLTLAHELMHAIFWSGQYGNCNDDEPLVEWCGKCLNTLLKQL